MVGKQSRERKTFAEKMRLSQICESAILLEHLVHKKKQKKKVTKRKDHELRIFRVLLMLLEKIWRVYEQTVIRQAVQLHRSKLDRYD